MMLPKEIMMPNDNPYALHRVKVLKVYSLTETEKLFLLDLRIPSWQRSGRSNLDSLSS